MTSHQHAALEIRVPTARVRFSNLWWAGAALVVMSAAILAENHWYLNFVHVFAGILWTGIDLFVGFVLGPILRRVDLDIRRAIANRLMPITLFLMPTLAIVTTTAGWYLAEQGGYFELAYPDRWWLIAALVIVGILTVQGMLVITPINIWLNIQLVRGGFEGPRVDRMMRAYVWLIGSQGLMQILIVVVMSRFVTGI